MNESLTYTSAFVLGLLGNVHCLAMCGGIVAAFSPPGGRTALQPGPPAGGPLPYNLGRISSYTIAGAIGGGFGFAIAGALGAGGVLWLRGLFGLLLIAAGAYIAGQSRAVAFLERLGGPVFRQLSRAIPALRPADRVWKAVLLGAIWGWLPCGLVYAALLGAVSRGSAGEGALFMLCFGVGTLPGLLVAGLAAARLRAALARSAVRSAAGAAVVLFGLWTVGGAVLGQAHFSHGSAPGGHSGHPAHETPEPTTRPHPDPVHPGDPAAP